MDVQVSLADHIPVLTLSGRFDASGAAQFDEAICALDNDTPFWVLDFSGVAYLSSIGLRSLVAVEKARRARDGGLILVGLTRSVRQVLELTHLDGWLRSMPTVSAALDAARAAALGPAAEYLVSERIIRVRRMAGSSTLEWWDGTRSERLISATLGDLGFAFGTGCFEENVADTIAAPGSFVATPVFAGVRSAEARGVSDFMTGGASATLPVHIVTALGVGGAPALVAEVISQEPFRLLDAVGDLWTVAAQELGSFPRTLGFIAVSETRPRNAVSDFARIEPIVKFEFPRLESDEELRLLLEFEAALTSVKRLGDAPPLVYRGNDPLVPRAHAVITLLRRCADVVTLFEQDMIPYWLAVLEWTYSVICYVQVSPRQKRYAACSAALICRALNELESENTR